MRTILIIFASALIFIALDLFWLSMSVSQFYKLKIGHLMAEKPNWLAAAVFYVFFISGMVYFVITPNLAIASIYKIILDGALFGAVCYATYDLTNHATLKDWPAVISIVDIAWGSIATSITSTAVWAIFRT